MAYENIIILAIFVIIIVIVIKIIGNKNKKKSIDHEVWQKQQSKKSDIETIKQEQNQKGLDLLKGRLASGKITKEDYDSLKKEFE